MALELFSIVGKLAITGMKQTQAGMAKVKTKVDSVSKGMKTLQAAQKKVSSGFTGMNTSIQGMNTKIQKSSAGLTAAGGILTGLGASITLLGGAALRTGAEFDSGMRKVAAVSGAAGSEIKSLRDIAKELGSTTQFSATQAADAMGFLAQAGFSANEVMGAIPSTLQLASAAQLDLASAADITSNILAGFGLEVEELGRANDVLVKTFTSANTDLVQLGQAMKFVGPVAKAAGVSFEETAAAVGLLGNAGIQASMAGTTLRGAITRMLSPSNEAKKVMARLGLEVQNTDGSFVGFKGIVGQLENSVTRLKDPTQFAADAMTLFGQRAGPGLLSLIDQGSEALGDLTAELMAAGGTAERISKVQMEGLRGAFLEFKSALEGVQIAIVESGIGDLFTVLVRKGAEVLRFFTNVNPEILKWGAIIVGAFGAAALVIGPFLLLLPTLSAGLAAVSGAIAGAGGIVAVLGTLATTVALPVAAVVALIAILVTWRTEISEVVAGISAWVTETGVVDVAIGGLKIAANAIASFFKDQFGPAIDTVKKAFGFLGDQVAKVVNFFREKGKKAMQEQADAAELLALREEGLAQTTANLHENEKELFESRKKAKTQTEAISKITDKLRKSLRLLEKAEKTGDRQARKILKTKIKLQEAERKRLLQGPKLVRVIKKEDKAVSALTGKVEDLSEEVVQFNLKEGDQLETTLKDLQTEIKNFGRDIQQEAIDKINKLAGEFAVLAAGAAPAFEAVRTEFRAVQAVLDDELLPLLTQTIPTITQDVVEAFKDMGIDTVAGLQAFATDAETKFNLIRDSGLAGPPQIEKAWIEMLKARKAALIANGTDLTTEEQTTLNTLLAKQKNFKDDSIGVGGPFQEWAAGVSSIVKDLSADLVKGLFTGDLSFGGSFGEKLKVIAGSFKTIFADKATDVINTFINTGLNMLLGKLDDIIGKLIGSGGIAGALDSAFGFLFGGSGGGGAAGAAVGAGVGIGADVAGQAVGIGAKAAGGGASSASGLAGLAATGPIGIAVAGAGVVSSVIGNFQMAGMNKKLKLIEKNTARTNQALVDRADGGIIGILFRVLESIDFGNNTKANEETMRHIVAHLGPIKDWVTAISTELSFGFNTKANEATRNILNDNLPRIKDSIENIRPNLSVNVSELVVREEADIDKIAKQLFMMLEQGGGVTSNI